MSINTDEPDNLFTADDVLSSALPIKNDKDKDPHVKAEEAPQELEKNIRDKLLIENLDSCTKCNAV